MVEGRIGGAQEVQMLALVQEEEGERSDKGFRKSTCLNHCRNALVEEVEPTLVGPLVVAEVVVAVGAGLGTLDRRTSQILMAQMSLNI